MNYNEQANEIWNKFTKMGEFNMEQHQILVYSYAKLILAPLYKSLQTNYNEKYAKKFIDAMTNQIFPALGIQ